MSTLNLNPFEHQLRHLIGELERQAASPVADRQAVERDAAALARAEDFIRGAEGGASEAQARAPIVQELLTSARALVERAQQRVDPKP